MQGKNFLFDVALAGNDEGRPGLVNQDGVHLVHDGEAVAALDLLLLVDGHIVPQVVEAKLVVGAVGDVCGVGLPAVNVYASSPKWDFPSEAVSKRIIRPLSVTKTGIGA